MRKQTTECRAIPSHAARIALSAAIFAAHVGVARTQDDPTAKRLLLRLGAERYQTRSFITNVTISADGRTMAVTEANVPRPYVRLFDLVTGRHLGRLTDQRATSGRITAIGFSPDGQRFLTGQSDGWVTLWDMTSRTVLARKRSHRGLITALAWSEDGTRWATADSKGRIELRNAQTDGKSGRILSLGKKKANPERGDSSGGYGLRAMSFSVDGSRLILANATAPGSILIVDVKSSEVERTIKLDAGASYNPAVNFVGVLSGGTSFLSAGQMTVPRKNTGIPHGPKNVTLTRLKVWDVKTGAHLRDLHSADQYGFGHAAVSPDGNEAVVADFSLLTSLDTKTGNVKWQTKLPGNWGDRPAYSPDGKHVAMKLGGGVAVFDTSDGRRRFPESNAGTQVRGVNWSVDGQSVVSGHHDGFVRLWDASSGELQWQQQLAPVVSPSGWQCAPDFVAVSKDTKTILAAGYRDDPVDFQTGVFRSYDRDTSRVRFTRTFKSGVRMGALSHDGRTAVVATSNGSIHDTHLYGIDVASGELLFATNAEGAREGLWSIEAIAFAQDSQQIRVAAGNSEVVTLNARSGEELDRVAVDWRTPEQVAARKTPQLWEGDFDRFATMLASSSAETLYIWDATSGDKRAAYRMPHLKGCYVCVAPDGRKVATCDLQYSGDYGDDVLRVYRPQTGELLINQPLDDTRATVMCFSPDSNRLFTGVTRGAAMIWDVALNEER